MGTLLRQCSPPPPTPNSLLTSPPFLHPFAKIPPRKQHHNHHPRAQITKNDRQSKKSIHSKPKTLDFDVPFLDSSVRRPTFDVIIIGAGPAGLRLSEQLSENGVKVCLIDPSPLSMWPRTYGVWVDEFENLGLQDCFEKTWTKSSVFVDEGKNHELGRAFGKVDRKKLKLRLLSNCVENGVEFHKAKVVKVEHEEFESWIACDDGSELRARLVVDAGGFETSFIEYDRPRNHGFQIVYGVLAEVDEHPFELDRMVLMDLRDSHLENDPRLRYGNTKVPSFLYALPMDSNLVFLEEAVLVSRPAMSIMEIEERLEARIKHLGIRVRTIVESEEGVIPLGGPLPRIPQRAMAFGGTSGLVNPSSAYMLSQAMAMAPILADAIAECLGSGKLASGKSLYKRAWKGLWPLERRCTREFYCLGMEVMMKLDLKGIRRFLDAFFEMDPYYLEGFFSSRLSLGEIPMFGYNIVRHASNATRLELAWKSPGPLVKSMGNLAIEAIRR